MLAILPKPCSLTALMLADSLLPHGFGFTTYVEGYFVMPASQHRHYF